MDGWEERLGALRRPPRTHTHVCPQRMDTTHLPPPLSCSAVTSAAVVPARPGLCPFLDVTLPLDSDLCSHTHSCNVAAPTSMQRAWAQARQLTARLQRQPPGAPCSPARGLASPRGCTPRCSGAPRGNRRTCGRRRPPLPACRSGGWHRPYALPARAPAALAARPAAAQLAAKCRAGCRPPPAPPAGTGSPPPALG